MTICEAIAKFEGFYVNGSRSRRNNNPGDINYGKFAQSHGSIGIERLPESSTGVTPRFAVFPDAATGFAAMHSLLEASYAGLTLRQMIYKYAPPTDHNDTERYLKTICEWTGLQAGDIPFPVAITT